MKEVNVTTIERYHCYEDAGMIIDTRIRTVIRDTLDESQVGFEEEGAFMIIFLL